MSLIITTVMVIVSYLVMGLFGLLIIILVIVIHHLFILIFLLASTTLGVTLLTIPLHFIGLIV